MLHLILETMNILDDAMLIFKFERIEINDSMECGLTGEHEHLLAVNWEKKVILKVKSAKLESKIEDSLRLSQE